MPLDNFIVYSPIPNTCIADRSTIYKHCFTISDCGVTGLLPEYIVDDLDQRWNCRICRNDQNYNNPVAITDTLYFQFQFTDTANTNREAPLFGWREAASIEYYIQIELIDSAGTVLANPIEDFATQWVVGWKTDRSYQSIEISVDKIFNEIKLLDCFSFKITTFDSTQTVVNEYFTEPFSVQNCDTTLVLRGNYKAFDCKRFYYGTFDNGAWFGKDNIPHILQWRTPATIKQGEVNTNLTTYNHIPVRQEIKEHYTIQLDKPIPDYLKTLLSARLFAAGNITVDAANIYDVDPFTTEDLDPYDNMFLGSYDVHKYCENKIHS